MILSVHFYFLNENFMNFIFIIHKTPILIKQNMKVYSEWIKNCQEKDQRKHTMIMLFSLHIKKKLDRYMNTIIYF